MGKQHINEFYNTEWSDFKVLTDGYKRLWKERPQWYAAYLKRLETKERMDEQKRTNEEGHRVQSEDKTEGRTV